MIRHSPRTADDAGFTLIELLVALSVLGILIAVAIPSFKAQIANGQTRTVAEALQNGIRFAQAESIRRGRTLKFYLTNTIPNGTSTGLATVSANNVAKYWTMETSALLTGETATAVQAGAIANTTPNVVIATNATSSTLTFNSIGRLVPDANGSQSLTFCVNNVLGGAGSSTGTCPATASAGGSNGYRRLNVTVTLGGQVRMCDPDKSATASTDGC